MTRARLLRHLGMWVLAGGIVSTVSATVTSADTPCGECYRAAQEAFMKCMDNAISQEDKNTCAINQDEETQRCEAGECKAERDAIEKERSNAKKDQPQ
ncbi:hypothetical protein W02_07440 [Nitrospira sp. KM1]|uniref:hypothetical protein n=1 Tax=Nitrospira sp. KM1 TaxID=1936990 RepID=UPI0013A75D04|nr:hypothetical protein [Nitrospira sp. KM1]BCA53604.1 hypothetical protein W02_07440 [Nitrospira sp. KM1]